MIVRHSLPDCVRRSCFLLQLPSQRMGFSQRGALNHGLK